MISKHALARLLGLGVILVLAACATGGSRTGADAALKNGDYLAAFRALKSDLAEPGAARRNAVRQLSTAKLGREGLIAGFTHAFDDTRSLDEVHQLTAELALAETSGVLSKEQTGTLHERLQVAVVDRVAAGAIFLHLGDAKDAPAQLLAKAEVKQRLVENTLQVIEASTPGSPGVRRAPVTALFQFLDREGSTYRELAAPSLPRLNFSIRELKFDVHPIFPDYAEQRLDTLITDVAIVGSTRLLEVDVGSILGQRDELAIIEDDQRADVVVKISELQYRERQIGPVQRPVKIAAGQFTPLLRPAGVPEGSAFVYDLVESTFDVEWAFEARIVREGFTDDHDIIRGVESRIDHQCHNGRYVTTSGKEIPSADWPTANVSLSCRGAGPPATAGLHPAIMKQLGQQILKRLVPTEPQ